MIPSCQSHGWAFALICAFSSLANAQPTPYTARTYDLRVTLVCADAHCGTPNGQLANMDDVHKALRQMVALTNFGWSEGGISFRLRDDLIRVVHDPADLPFATVAGKDLVSCAGQRYCEKDSDCYHNATATSACIDNACAVLCDANGACSGGPSTACVQGGVRTEDPTSPTVDYCSCDRAEYERRYADDPTVIDVVVPVGHAGKGGSWWTNEMVFMPFPRAWDCVGPVSSQVAGGGCLYDGALFAHELGHYFGLAHTHKFRTDAAFDAWSDFNGDYIADTPPDPAKPEIIHFAEPACVAPANATACPVGNECPQGEQCINGVCAFGTAPNQICDRGFYQAQACVAPAGPCLQDACIDGCSGERVCVDDGAGNAVCGQFDTVAGAQQNGSCNASADCAFQYSCVANVCTFGAHLDWAFDAHVYNRDLIRDGQVFCVGGEFVFEPVNSRWSRNDNLQTAQNSNVAYTPVHYGSPICYWRRPSDPNDPNSPFITQEVVWAHWAPPGGWQPKANRIICADSTCAECDGAACPAANVRELPNFTNLMGYHVKGPAVINGHYHSSLSAGQLDKIKLTFRPEVECDEPAEYAATNGRCGVRRRLIDVCAAEGGDTDRDGICDNQDPCPTSGPLGQSHVFTASVDNMGVPTPTDSDADGIPNECDLCPGFASPNNLDFDGDGLGDPCDPDRDNDGCPNDDDKNPDYPLMLSHWQDAFIDFGCINTLAEAVQSFAGVDHDGDGLLSCDDDELDSDNDGDPDVNDLAPLLPNVNNPVSPQGPCASAVVTGCFGPQCNLSYTVRIESAINPVWFIDLPPVFSFGREALFMRPSANAAITLRDVMTQMQSADPGLLLVIYKGATMVSRWKFHAEDLTFDPSGHGDFIKVLLPETNGETLHMELTHSSTVAPDTDGDGVIDPIDNCTLVTNPSQHDRDLDKVGDHCDGDVDGDGISDADDLSFVKACLGTRVHLTADQHGQIVDDALACAPADLNHDGEVDQADIDDIITPNWKQPIGPSAWVP